MDKHPIHNLVGAKLSFSTAYHSQMDCLAERMIQTVKDMIRRVCAYRLEFKDSDGFTHDRYTLIPALELRYKTSIHSSTVDIHPTPSSFIMMLDKARHHEKRCIEDYFKYAKERWHKSNQTFNFKIGDLVLISTLNLNNIKGPNKLKYSFTGPLMMKALHGPNAVQLELIGKLMSKHPAFPVSLIKPYSSSDKQLFP
ncbi:hypothetical protein O181_123820 [Austropuccinia psidii MF-1]|uniref:Integrase catalytic domain-containing protein n=1 Tax=Austropuccinia psidii MF-1 TaxID=1389203 RepID=A0A9Q3Q4K4_9BASI|nr:hypothetical protein [Austropuccinia psidii MF-1]